MFSLDQYGSIPTLFSTRKSMNYWSCSIIPIMQGYTVLLLQIVSCISTARPLILCFEQHMTSTVTAG